MTRGECCNNSFPFSACCTSKLANSDKLTVPPSEILNATCQSGAVKFGVRGAGLRRKFALGELFLLRRAGEKWRE